MNTDEVKKEIELLIKKIDHFNEQYYQNSISEISDFEFDQLLKRLENSI